MISPLPRDVICLSVHLRRVSDTWLEAELGRSLARWPVQYVFPGGHYPQHLLQLPGINTGLWLVHPGQRCPPAHLDLDIVQCETNALGAAGTTHVSLIYLDVLGSYDDLLGGGCRYYPLQPGQWRQASMAPGAWRDGFLDKILMWYSGLCSQMVSRSQFSEPGASPHQGTHYSVSLKRVILA